MAQIETLTTVWDARFDKLEQKLNNVVKANYGAAAKIEAAWGSVNDNMDLAVSRGAGVLAGLGGAGLAAATGIGVATVAVTSLVGAFQQARAAAQFADDLQDTADKVHLTTDALQEYQYALDHAGGSGKDAADAFNDFSETIGKAQAGLKGALRPFQELGFTKEQVKSFTDADTALRAVTERIAGLSDVQQDAVIQQLGLEKMAPLIRSGVDEMERLRAQAHEVGVVMDAELVKRGAELNSQFEDVTKVIDLQLKSALVDLAPILVGLLKLVADLAKAAADVADAFRSIENKTTSGLQDRRSQLNDEATRLGLRQIRGQRLSAPEQQRLDRINGQISEIDAQLASRSQTNTARPITRALAEPPGRGGRRSSSASTRDTTEQRVAQVNAALASSGRDLYQAMLGLTSDIEARAEIEKAIARQEAEAAQARLDKQIAEVKGDKGIKDEATRRQLVANLEIAKQNEQEAADAKQRAIDARAVFELEDRRLETYQAIVNATIDQLQAEADSATTAAARAKIEKRILELRQQLASDLEGARIDRAVKTGEISKDEGDQRKGALAASQSAERSQFDLAHEDPLQKYLRSIKDTDTAFKELEVNGISSLIDGLAAAGAGARNLGDVFRQTLQQMAIEANRILLQSLLTGGSSGGGGLFGSLLKGAGSLFGGGGNLAADLKFGAALNPNLFAGGGFVSGPGSHTSDSIPARLSNGEYVINAAATQRYRGLLDSINAGIMPRLPAANTNSQTYSPTLNMHVTVQGGDVRGARRTAAQMGASAMRQMAMARRKGY